ncbi:hypothetical protein X801_05617 [Opisthorchis viverrini]|uniref:Diphthine--ammonia ligase n=1 Tax=Opisthorchis viverrini TaxID=6198 RepID=A0A1S8WVQ7_OPIVI|nr:hypothetical protein X801_05617 [Opisthorchis viverrini]
MRGFIALVSGGKDSIFSIMECVAHEYKLEAVVNLSPTPEGSHPVEIDSYMYQSVASEGVRLIAEALQVPLYQFPISGKPYCQSLQYEESADDEVEDLFQALSKVKADFPSVHFISSGAILSDYQRIRVEHVASRLRLQPIAFLWQVPTDNLIRAMLAASLDAVIVKIASFGLEPRRHLGAHLSDVVLNLRDLSQPPWSLNICGEGGEYESFTLDCPLFRRRIQIRSPPRVVCHSEDESYPVAYLHLTRLELEDKPAESVRTSTADILSIEGVDPFSEEPKLLRPFMSPIDRLRELRHQLTLEIRNDRTRCQLNSQCVPLSNPRTNVPTSKVESKFQTFGNGEFWVTTICVGIEKPVNSGDLKVLGSLTKQVTQVAISELQSQLGHANLQTDCIIHNLAVLNQSLSSEVFTAFNEAYVDEFGLPWETATRDGGEPRSYPRIFPPTRACVSVNRLLGPGGQCFENSTSVAVSLTAVVHPSPSNQPAALTGLCRGLHVRSLSHWAPANIGPYSQALSFTRLGSSTELERVEDTTEWTFYSGQIGLIPETMTLPQFDSSCAEDAGDEDCQWNRSLRTQCLLVIRHCHRTLKAMSSAVWSDLAVGICYGTSSSALRCARQTFHDAVCDLWYDSHASEEKPTIPFPKENCLVQCLCESHIAWLIVSDLPKQASVEWQLVTRSPSCLQVDGPPVRYDSYDALTGSGASLIFCPVDYMPRHCYLNVIPIMGILNQSDAAVGLYL